MNADKSEIFQTSQGLKYSMDREMWEKIYNYSVFHHGKNGTTALEFLEWNITAVELFPSFLCFLQLIIDSIFHTEYGSRTVYFVISVAFWYICGTLLVRLNIKFFSVQINFFDLLHYGFFLLLNFFVWIYFILTKYNIDLIIIILISIFVLHKWYIALIFVSEKFVLHTIYCFTYGSYAALKPIHDRIGKSILQWIQE